MKPSLLIGMVLKVTSQLRGVVLCVSILLVASCAQVPKESAELSVTLGRDISSMRSAHLALFDMYANQLIQDINSFIDQVYAPYQIREIFNDSLWKAEILQIVQDAADESSGDSTTEAFEKLEILIASISEEVEAYRRSKLLPLQDRLRSTRSEIEQGYQQLHVANAVVTGHLRSVARVHDLQSDILAKASIPDIRQTFGEATSDFSSTISELTIKASKGEEKFSELVEKFNEALAKINQ